jgi:NTP pyrophosphatase (non-canonical NTP hydrolase)
MSITIEEMQKQVHNLAREKGWWPLIPRQVETPTNAEILFEEVNIPEKLMLMVSELGEALEHYRGEAGTLTFFSEENNKKPDGMWIELADCIIRILDLAGAYHIDMESFIRMKHEYNKTRPYRHGGKKC